MDSNHRCLDVGQESSPLDRGTLSCSRGGNRTHNLSPGSRPGRFTCLRTRPCDSGGGARAVSAVTKGRVELPRQLRHDALSVVCLPVPPLGQVGREALESSSAVHQTAARPSQLPAQTKRPGISRRPAPKFIRCGWAHWRKGYGNRTDRSRLRFSRVGWLFTSFTVIVIAASNGQMLNDSKRAWSSHCLFGPRKDAQGSHLFHNRCKKPWREDQRDGVGVVIRFLTGCAEDTSKSA